MRDAERGGEMLTVQAPSARGVTLRTPKTVGKSNGTALVKAISLHKYKKDHVAHLAPATTAAIGAMLGLPTEVIFQAVNQAVHLSFSTRQSRKGEISSWKAYVPGFSGKLAIECVDRAMRGEGAPFGASPSRSGKKQPNDSKDN